jgi:hypothetical protein
LLLSVLPLLLLLLPPVDLCLIVEQKCPWGTTPSTMNLQGMAQSHIA